MAKRVIGIIPPAKLYEDDIPHRDQYLFGNPYVSRLERLGALPVGMLPVDARLSTDALALCDGFLIAGGNRMWPYHLQVVAYALAVRKPLLGICLGMQVIAAYFQVLTRAKAQDDDADMLALFETMKRERFMFNHPVADHYLPNVTRETAAHSRHPVQITPGTRLHEAAGLTEAEGVSLHGYRIAPPTAELVISATAPDGTIEGIEHGGFLVGVQFHPEVDDRWDGLFQALIDGRWLSATKGGSYA